MIRLIEQLAFKCPGITSIRAEFDFNYAIISKIKELNGSIWNKKDKYWEIPMCELSRLIDSLTTIDDIEVVPLKQERSNLLSRSIEYKTKPFDYQLDGIDWLINNNDGLLLDAPGLGKSLQLIYAAEELKLQKGIEHCLIICGINTLKTNWEREIFRHSSLDCRVVGKKIGKNGRVSYASVDDRAKELSCKINEFFVILNIESIRDDKVLKAIKSGKNSFDMIIVDEVHKCKNPSTASGKALLKLSNVGTYHYGLTGTLITNKPTDCFVPLKFINKEHSTWSAFKNQYCVIEKTMYSNYGITGYKNTDILKKYIDDCSLRRSKDLLSLPPRTIINEYVEMSNEHEKFYHELEKGAIEEADRINITTKSQLGLVVREKQAATCPSLLTSKQMTETKLERAAELVNEIIDNGEKVVIFSTFKYPLYKLFELLKDYEPLICTGDSSQDEIDKNIDKFQNDPSKKVLLGTMQKMSTGITLTSASYMITLDQSWVPSEMQQMMDRIYRIGTSKNVTVYNLVSVGTIDERVINVLARKQGISDYITDGITPEEDIKYLLGL